MTVALWASAFVGIRAVIDDFSPGALALGRPLTGAAVLAVVVAIRRPARTSRRAVPFIVASGVLWFALYTVTLNAAERYVDAGTASMLVNVGPILIAILGGLFLAEGFPPRLFAGSAVAFAGAAVIGLATSASSTSSDPTLGIALCLLAAVAYAVGVVLQKPAVRDTPALTVTWLACTVGAVALVPFAPALVEETRSAAPNRSPGCCTSVCSRRLWRSRPGPSRSAARPPAGWARPPISSRRSPSSSAGSSSASPRPSPQSSVV